MRIRTRARKQKKEVDIEKEEEEEEGQNQGYVLRGPPCDRNGPGMDNGRGSWVELSVCFAFDARWYS